jgi:anti-sigma-K factor RskA
MSDQGYRGLTNDEILEMLPAFVVGALDPDEMLEVEEYIHAHPELMARVHELEVAAARLAYSAPPQPLPQALHDKVMARAQASLPPRPQPATVRVDGPIVRPVAPPVKEENWFARWWRNRGLFDLAMVAATAAVLILSVVYVGALTDINDLQSQVQGLEQQVATMQEQNSELEQENIRLQSELDTSLNQMASIAGAQQSVALGGTEAAPNASGTLYVDDDTGTLVLSNLAGLDENQVYQLWLIPADGTAPIPAGLLGQAGEPMQTISLELPATLDGIAAVGISVEPPGGSAAPTGPIVLLGETA